MIDNALDLAHWRQELAWRTRAQVGPYLQPEAAEALHRCLVEDVPWSLAIHDGAGSRTLPPEARASLGIEGERELVAGAAGHARSQFAFAYECYQMVKAYADGHDPGLLLHRVLEFFNSPDYLAFARALTGDPLIRRIDAQATRYRPGHFLTLHDDGNHGDEGRRFAYVLNLSRDWRADDGGLLHFIAADGRVVDTLVPRFNSLSIFRVPQAHAVTLVAPWARGDRLAITGWMRS
jgi:Rps23 Pro-64 3,4-dihydroxylase Tpa1-like proline 4-hydroxylase